MDIQVVQRQKLYFNGGKNRPLGRKARVNNIKQTLQKDNLLNYQNNLLLRKRQEESIHILQSGKNENGHKPGENGKEEEPAGELSRGHKKVQELKSLGIFVANLGKNRAAVGIGVLVVLEYLSQALKGIFQVAKPPSFIKSPEDCFKTNEVRKNLVAQLENADMSEEDKQYVLGILNDEEKSDEQKAFEILQMQQDSDEQRGSFARQTGETFQPRPSGGAGSWGSTSFQQVFESGQAKLQDLYDVIDANGRQIEQQLNVAFNRNQGEGGLKRPSGVSVRAGATADGKEAEEKEKEFQRLQAENREESDIPNELMEAGKKEVEAVEKGVSWGREATAGGKEAEEKEKEFQRIEAENREESDLPNEIMEAGKKELDAINEKEFKQAQEKEFEKTMAENLEESDLPKELIQQGKGAAIKEAAGQGKDISWFGDQYDKTMKAVGEKAEKEGASLKSFNDVVKYQTDGSKSLNEKAAESAKEKEEQDKAAAEQEKKKYSGILGNARRLREAAEAQQKKRVQQANELAAQMKQQKQEQQEREQAKKAKEAEEAKKAAEIKAAREKEEQQERYEQEQRLKEKQQQEREAVARAKEEETRQKFKREQEAKQQQELKKRQEQEKELRKRQEQEEVQRQKVTQASRAYQKGAPAKNGANIQQELQKEGKILRQKLAQMDQKGMLKQMDEKEYAVLLERMMGIISQTVSGEQGGQLGDVGVKDSSTKEQLDQIMASSIDVIKQKVKQSEVGPQLSNIQDTFGRAKDKKDDKKVLAAGGGGYGGGSGGGGGGAGGGRPGGRGSPSEGDEGDNLGWVKYALALVVVGLLAAAGFYYLQKSNVEEQEREKELADERIKKQEKKIPIPPVIDEKLSEAEQKVEKVVKNKNFKTASKILVQFLAVGLVLWVFKKKRPFDQGSEGEEKDWRDFMGGIWKAIKGPFSKDDDEGDAPGGDAPGGGTTEGGPDAGGSGGDKSKQSDSTQSKGPDYAKSSLYTPSQEAGSSAPQEEIEEDPKERRQAVKEQQNFISNLDKNFGQHKQFGKFQGWLQEVKGKQKNKDGLLDRRDINNGLKALGEEIGAMRKQGNNLDKEFKKLQQQKEKGEQQVGRLQGELDENKKQNKALQKQVQEKSKESSKYQSKIVDSEKELVNLTEERRQLANNMDNMGQSLKDLEQQKQDLAKKVDELQGSLQQKDKQASEEEAELEQLQEKLLDQSQQLKDTQNEYEVLKKKNESNDQMIKNLEEKLMDAEQQPQYLRMQYHVTQQHLAEKVQEINDQEDQISLLQQDKSDLQRQVQEKESLLQEAIGTLTQYQAQKTESGSLHIQKPSNTSSQMSFNQSDSNKDQNNEDFSSELDNMQKLLEKFNKDNQAKDQELQAQKSKSRNQEQILKELNDKLQDLKAEQAHFQEWDSKLKSKPRDKSASLEGKENQISGNQKLKPTESMS